MYLWDCISGLSYLRLLARRIAELSLCGLVLPAQESSPYTSMTGEWGVLAASHASQIATSAHYALAYEVPARSPLRTDGRVRSRTMFPVSRSYSGQISPHQTRDATMMTRRETYRQSKEVSALIMAGRVRQ